MAHQIPLFGLVRPKVDIVVDVSNLVFRAAFRFKELSHNGAPTGHIYGALSMITALKTHYGLMSDVRFVYAYDGRCRWRRDLLPEYKANRGKRAETSSSMMTDARDFLSLLPGLTIEAPNDEADDVIAAHVCTNSTKTHYVFSKDRDLWQLIGPRTHVITSSKDPPVDAFNVQDDFYTSNPKLIPLSKAMIGDTSDNVPGVKGFPRDDLKLILERLTRPHVPDLLVSVAELQHEGRLKPRTQRLAESHVEHIEKMLKITTLNSACQYSQETNQHSKEELDRKLIDIACTSMIEKTNCLY